MPTPSRTSLQDIVSAGRHILESGGLEDLTMARIAHAVGVRPPSLYKHVRDRGDLIRVIGNDTLGQLGGLMTAASGSGDPLRDLRAMACIQRAFAHQHPEAYRLLWLRLPEGWRVDADLNARATEPVLRAVAGLVGEDAKLVAARTFVAWAQGFVGMELAGAFRLGGDVDAAFDYGLECLLEALSRHRQNGSVDTRVAGGLSTNPILIVH
jgi:AcrR family transcriptional regulator